MVFHTQDGLAFLGLRERGGHWQIIYDHLSGKRLVLSLANDADKFDAIQNALRTAAFTKNTLASLAATLTTHKIAFHVA